MARITKELECPMPAGTRSAEAAPCNHANRGKRDHCFRLSRCLRAVAVLLMAVMIAARWAGAEGPGSLSLRIRGEAEPFVATLSGGPTPYIGYQESIRGEGVRFRNVPAGKYLLRLETERGAILNRVVTVESVIGKSKETRVMVRLEEAVLPADWQGGALSIPAKKLAWPASTTDALRHAWQHMQRGEISRARSRLRQAIQHSPDCVDAWTNLGLVAEWDGSFDEAVRFHRQAVRLDPDGFGANLNLSEALEKMGKDEEAIQYGDRALRIRPQDLGVNLHMGILLVHAHQFREALAPLNTAKRIHPDSLGTAQILLGVAYVETGQAQQALEEFNGWLAKNPIHERRELVAATAQELRDHLNPLTSD